MMIMRFLVLVLLFSACSSAPKNPGDVNDQRRRAESRLEQGNKHADRGNLEVAMSYLEDAYLLAIATDDPGLRIRAGLSRSNTLFSQGYNDEANYGWREALDEAERIGDRELAAVCRIHIARGILLDQGRGAAQSVRDDVSRDLAFIRTDQLYIAFAWTVIALAERELGRYAEAEASIRRSLGIHENNRNLELVAYNWFLIASFRSLAGNYNGALQALDSAITYDRRVENSWGLANDWRAIGEVHTRAGNTGAARAAFLRSAAIFQAVNADDAAEEVLARIE
ncbi:MAG: hypothetical protein FWG89_05120 [Treponema sp.]|nr:hypothetical protein [Treponema sp.]